MKGVIDTTFDEGKFEVKLEIAKALNESGVSFDISIKTTGLSENEINKRQDEKIMLKK